MTRSVTTLVALAISVCAVMAQEPPKPAADNETHSILSLKPATNQNMSGTYGEIYLDGDPAGYFNNTGILLKAGTRPYVVAQAGTNGDNSGFAVYSAGGAEALRVQGDLMAGMGTFKPDATLHIASRHEKAVIIAAQNSAVYNAVFKDLAATEGYGSGVLFEMTGYSMMRVSNLQLGHLGTPVVNSVNAALRLNKGSAQDVIIGDAAHTTTGLHVQSKGPSTFGGAVQVAGNLTITGDVTVNGNIAAKYQDLAEWVPSDSDLEPGTVVVLSGTRVNTVKAAASAYDTSVAGVVSPQPGLILGEGGSGKELIATTGRVKVKVDATSAPVKIGDLLVSSDTAGMAMKSEPMELNGRTFHQPGTIIGKALEPLAGGRGEILVLLSLQ